MILSARVDEVDSRAPELRERPRESAIEIERVTRHYETKGGTVRALDGVSLSLGRGEFAAIAGPSGSGKTTLLNLMGALDRPTEGEVIIDGHALSTMSRRQLSCLRRDSIGFVFQSHNLLPVMTAFENVEYILLLQGVKRDESRERVMRVLAEVGLEGLASRRPGELSGGQRQRVAVARAIVSRPALVLADEPTASLDSTAGTAGRELIDVMHELNQMHRITFIFSTHDSMITERASRLIRLRDGRIQTDEHRTEVCE